MRHLRKNKKFHRNQEDRLKLFRDLSSALVRSGQITTFTARAKWFRSRFERLITLVKRAGDDIQLAFRRLRPYLSESDARKLIQEIVPGLKDRQGGYTAVYKLSLPFTDLDKSLVRLVELNEPKSETDLKEIKESKTVNTVNIPQTKSKEKVSK